MAYDTVITGMILIFHRYASVLFYPGSTYSYVSSYFAPYLDMPRGSLDTLVHVSIPVGDSIVVDHVYPFCIVTTCGYETSVDLLLLSMVDVDMILGRDWLSTYHAILDCHTMTVTLAVLILPRLELICSLGHTPNVSADTPTIDLVPVRREFLKVFPTDLQGMPPDRDIYFGIDLVPGMLPISIPPYRMAPAESKKLEEQLEKMLEKGFIGPSVSLWGAPMLFVNKKDGAQEHKQHLRIVLQILREKKLYGMFSKCEFWLDSVALLGHVVSSVGIKVDLMKIDAVQNLPRPSTATEIRRFLGVVGYYHCFVEGFSYIAALLTKLTQKGASFRWSDGCKDSF
ncbi:uncharacterized protein [Nicotiana tomentosiformis]|uniref:uncharacterized protein n=1 Tax=Nicotiana tomentosiformis TaxID=4098 RepID=UPI00388C5D05